MSDNKPRIVCVGEAMVELSRRDDGRFALGYGGDTFSTAVYLARRQLPVAYATALGDDPYSDGIRAFAAAEGVGGDLMLRVPGRLPGLYLIDADAHGARGCRTWHEAAPARELFELPQWAAVAEGLLRARLILFSGNTLASYSNLGIGRFIATLEVARQNGARVVFDGHFRAALWRGGLARGRAVFTEALKRVDIALPSFHDEALMWGDSSPNATVQRLQAFGIAEIVVKNGAEAAIVAAGQDQEAVPVPAVVTPQDATAAGDSFNAAYLAARLSGAAPSAAALAGHALAAEVIAHPGAILPRAATAVH